MAGVGSSVILGRLAANKLRAASDIEFAAPKEKPCFPATSWCQEFATRDRVIDLSNDNKKEQKTMCKQQAGRKSYISLLASSQEKMELK
jgi:hypothetical protein